MNLEALKYPIGKFVSPTNITEGHIDNWKSTIQSFPDILRALVLPLTLEELQYPYRPGGWTINQVIHHVSDSHAQALHRFKLSLTENMPVIKPYEEALWAELSDYRTDLIDASLQMLQATHIKWSVLLDKMTIGDFETKGYIHPEYNTTVLLTQALGTYDWHCRHHLEHINQALEHKGQFQ